jgi:tyrosyl-tRNA synthetase
VGNVWLDPAKTSPYQFYQFWINTEDLDVKRYLVMFTFLSLEDIDRAMSEHAQDPGKRVAQRLLARDVTARVHGEAATEEAIRTSAALFGGTSAGKRGATREALAEMPTRQVSRSKLSGLSVVELLVASGLATSKADARRGIQGKGFYLNDEPIETADLRLGEDQLQGPPDGRFLILRKGKKNYVRLVLEP